MFLFAVERRARERRVEDRFAFVVGDQDVWAFDEERFAGLQFADLFRELLLGLEDEVFVRFFFDRQVDVVERHVGFVFDADVHVIGHAFVELAFVGLDLQGHRFLAPDLQWVGKRRLHRHRRIERFERRCVVG